MTWPAALSAAAVRVMRTAAGRRALQLALLVGGLFVLGFLCGEQAHAADAVPPVSAAEAGSSAPADGLRELTRSTVGRVVHPDEEPAAPDPGAAADAGEHTPPRTDPAPSAPAEPKPEPRPTPTPTPKPASPGNSPASRTPTPDTGQLVESVGSHVLRPVGDLVETVTSGLTGTPVTLPSLPALPGGGQSSWPGLPTLPGLPGAPSVPGLPLPAPVSEVPQPQPYPPVSAPAAGRTPDVGNRPSGLPYGPEAAGLTAGPTSAQAAPHRTAVPAPTPQTPPGDPDGALGGKSAVGSGTSRHSDAHAVTPHHRAPLALAPGAAARVGAAAVQDRHRDIPVSPA